VAEPKTNLRVAITGDLADIKSALVGLNAQLAKTGTTGAKAGADASKGLAGLDSAAKSVRNRIAGLFAGITVGAFLKGVIDNTRESEAAIAQLNAGLESTKGIAGVTAGEISNLADSLAATTTFGDDAIVSMASVLTTFTNIRTVIFKDAIPAILDLSTRMKVDLDSAAKLVGKALNDPIKGITLLGKAIGGFSPIQKKQIEDFVKLGDVAAAQRVILEQLATTMGGSATAAADTLGGSIDQAKNAFGNLLEGDSSSGGLLEVKTAFQDLTKTLSDPDTKEGFQTIISGLANVASYAANAIAQLGNFTKGVRDALSLDADKTTLGLLTKKRQLEDDLAGLGNSSFSAVKQLYFGREVGDVGEVNIRLLESLEQNRTRMQAELANIDALLAKRRALANAPAAAPEAPRPAGLQADPLVDEAAIKRAEAEAKRKLEALRRERERLLEESKRADAQRVKEMLDLEAKVTDAMIDIEISLKRAMGDEAGAAFADIDRKYAELIADLKTAGRTDGVEIVERLINLEKVDAQLELFKQKMQAATQASTSTIDSLAGQAAGGVINTSEADSGREAALQSELQVQQQLLATAQAYLATLAADSPGAQKTLQFIEQLKGRIGEVQATQNQFMADVKNQAVQSLTGFFSDLASGAKTFKDAFLDMVRNFVAGIAQMIAQKLALKAVDAIFSAFHTGGVVGAGGGSPRSGINPMVFGLAPRYHTGGIAGLAPNEVPAILQRGEEVLTKNDRRHRLNGGAGAAGKGSQKFVFLFDANATADHMQTAQGEQATLVNIGRNAGAVRELLGI
jgi:hypothetical protein